MDMSAVAGLCDKDEAGRADELTKLHLQKPKVILRRRQTDIRYEEGVAKEGK